MHELDAGALAKMIPKQMTAGADALRAVSQARRVLIWPRRQAGRRRHRALLGTISTLLNEINGTIA